MQLFPYGWQLPDGSVMREADYRGMVEAANATYRRWMNPYPQHAFFRSFAAIPRWAIMESHAETRCEYNVGGTEAITPTTRHTLPHAGWCAGRTSQGGAMRVHGASIQRLTMTCRGQKTGSLRAFGHTRRAL